MNYINILSTHLQLLYALFFVRKRHAARLIKRLNMLLAVHDQQLTADQLKRIDVYTTTGFYVNYCLATLRGQPMSATEVKNTLNLSILTPQLDDLYDTLKLSSTEILEQLHQGTDDNITGRMLLPKYLYGQIIAHNDNAGFQEIFSQALKAQDESLQQLEEEWLSEEQLIRITREKGGLWTLLFRLMLTHPLKKGEKEAILSLGHLLQLTNDMYDVYKDTGNGQQTLFTNATDMTHNEKAYHSLIDNMMQQFSLLDYDRENIIKCLNTVSMISALGKICLKQLKSCQTRTNGIFKADGYTRSQLVCDMAKWTNRREYIDQSIQSYRQVKKFW